MSRKKMSDDYSSDDEEKYGKKPRRDSDNVDIEERVESLISRVGDKASNASLESNLEGLANVLEADLSNHKTKILKILCDYVKSIPQRMSVYTTLVGILNAKNYIAGGEFVDLVVRNLKEALKTHDYPTALHLLRFLADLVNCRVIMSSSIIVLFNTFMEAALEDGIPQLRSDWFVYAILSSLPWVGKELSIKKEEDLERLMTSIQIYLSKREKSYVAALKVWSSEEGLPLEEYLDSLWMQIQTLRQKRWEENCITRPYMSFETLLRDALQHTIPIVLVPSHVEEQSYPMPTMTFRIFNYTDLMPGLSRLPSLHSMERYIIEEFIISTIENNYLERKICADALLTITVSFKVPINYMIVEAVFGQLFQLPKAPHLELMYGALLIELCKLQPSSMPQVLAQATGLLYERLNSMNTTCIERFANWFAYHLSNFQFKWSWEDWIDCITNEVDSPKFKFVQETLRRCLRLSYHQRVSEIVPLNFQALVPPEPRPIFKFADKEANLPGTEIAYNLLELFGKKGSPEEVQIILLQIPESENLSNQGSLLRIDVFVQCLMYFSSKTISHTFAGLTKFHPIYKWLMEGNTEEMRIEKEVQLLTSFHDIWANKPQIIVTVVDKLLKTQVVECFAVVTWIFSAQMNSTITSFFVTEILHSTLRKMIKQISKLQHEVEEMKDKLEEHEQKKRDNYDYDDINIDLPSEETIEKGETQIDDLLLDQKKLFILLSQSFVRILSNHINYCESQSKSYKNSWYKIISERLQEFLFVYKDENEKYLSSLEKNVFTSDIDPQIFEIYNQFLSIIN